MASAPTTSTTLQYARLTSRAVVEVSGPDWRTFLQGLLTQDVLTLATGEARFAALLTPQGKLLLGLFVVGGQNGCFLDVPAERREALVQRLTMYRLRAKVEINDADAPVMALWLSTTAVPANAGTQVQPLDDVIWAPAFAGETGSWIADPRLGALGWRGLDTSGFLEAVERDEGAYQTHRLALGVPDPAADFIPDKTYPIEANFDLLGGIDFKKGCFVGQETTSRMKRRGQIKSRMLPIRFEGPPPPFGAEVLAGELRAGEVLSGREGAAMALLRLDRIEGAALSVDGRPVEAWRPAWFDAAQAL